MKKFLVRIAFGALFFGVAWSRTLAANMMGAMEKKKDGIVAHFADGFLSVRFFSDSIVHVFFAKDRRFFNRKTIDVVGTSRTDVQWSLKTTPESWELQGSRLAVVIDRMTGKVSFLDQAGLPILQEDDRQMEPAQVQGEKTFHVRQQWKGRSTESLYGLGERQLGMLDIKGYDLDLWQHNTNAVIPFLVSSSGYGILWENTSFTRFGDLEDFVPIPAEDLLDKTGKPGGLSVGPLVGSSSVSTSADLKVEFKGKDWNNHPPATRWEGSLLAPTTGDYQFLCRSNGGIKVWVDGKLVMDQWRQKWLTANDQVKVSLEAGKRYPLKIEWDTEQGTSFNFLWKPQLTLDSESNAILGGQNMQKYLGLDKAHQKLTYSQKDNNWVVGDQIKNTSLWSEVGDGIDYYFVYGPELDKVIAGYRTLTGPAPMMPGWAFGLWQSRQRYEKAQDSLDVVDGFRKRHIPFDNIVQDWRYWPDGAWGSHQFDPARFPDPEGWLKSLHDQHAHIMISVWGKFNPGTDNFEAMEKKGFLYEPLLKEGMKDWLGQPYSFYDAFNPSARKLFWDQINDNLFQKGIDAWWMDASEPDITPSPPVRADLVSHMDPVYGGIASRMLLGYPLMNGEGIYEGQRQAAPNQRVFILTRCGFAGEQRYAAAVWSGDITSTWSALAKQIPAGLGFSLSGVPYWTTDTGGYTMQGKFSTRHPKPEDEEEWRELNARWFEFSTFCPLLRVHGELRPREMWELGDEKSSAYQTELKFDRLRYRLFPYLYSTAWSVTDQGEIFMRPLVMDFPDDQEARGITDEYFFGHAFLVAPVTQYKARDRQVYLPKGSPWYDFWTGKAAAAGWQKVDAPYDSLPLFVRAGSIVPLGPELQYIGEKAQDPLTLYVYTGSDGDFNLYEDDGLTYDYEKGAYSETPFHWDEASRTLTIGERKGSFPGMLKNRTIRIVVVGPHQPAGFSFAEKPTRVVEYTGAKAVINLRKP